MRIISGKFKGRRLNPPKGLPVRPTTDRVKESLFNILRHRFELDEVSVLDLFCGTGNMSMEFASRGAQKIISVDAHGKCVHYVRQLFEDFEVENATAIRADVLKFLEQPPLQAFDLIFVDPPYTMPGQEMMLHSLLTKGWLAEDGQLILEHNSVSSYDHIPYFIELRHYGSNILSFFGYEGQEENS